MNVDNGGAWTTGEGPIGCYKSTGSDHRFVSSFAESFSGCFTETRVNEREANGSQSDKVKEKEEHGGGQGDNLIRHWEGCHGDDTKPRPPSGTLRRFL